MPIIYPSIQSLHIFSCCSLLATEAKERTTAHFQICRLVLLAGGGEGEVGLLPGGGEAEAGLVTGEGEEEGGLLAGEGEGEGDLLTGGGEVEAGLLA